MAGPGRVERGTKWGSLRQVVLFRKLGLDSWPKERPTAAWWGSLIKVCNFQVFVTILTVTCLERPVDLSHCFHGLLVEKGTLETDQCAVCARMKHKLT